MSAKQWPLPKRLDFIKQLKESGTPIGQQQLEFQGELRFYPVYVVDLAFPCYRLGNGRTQAAQQEIIAREGLAEEFFSGDPDSEPALVKQHEILRSMVTSGTDAQISDILRKSRQTQPLILDNEGYVVNGNRRLCAMRVLFEENTREFARFEHIQVVFLPPCTQNDIEELEAKLQWLPDGRSDYSWVDKAIVLRQRQQRGWTIEKLCSFYEMSRPAIQLAIGMLEDAEAYLEERGAHGEYSRVLDKTYAFEQLQRGRRKCGDDEPRKQFFTAVSYLMLDDPNSTGRRLYESIPEALDSLDDVAEQLKADFTGVVVQNGDIGNLDILGGETDSPYRDVCLLVRSPAHYEKAREVVRDKLEEMRTKKKERLDATYCLREARKAYASLQNVSTNLDVNCDRDGLPALMGNIDVVCAEIKGRLNDGANQS